MVNDATSETLKDFTMSLSIMTPYTELLAELGQPNQARVRIFMKMSHQWSLTGMCMFSWKVIAWQRSSSSAHVLRPTMYVGVLFDVTSLSASIR